MTYAAAFSVNSTSFKDSVTWALKGFDQKADNSYILFEIDVEDSSLSVSSVSLQYYFRDRIGIESFNFIDSDDSSFREQEEKKVRFAVDGSMLSKVVSVLPKGKDMKVKETIRNSMRTLNLSVPGQKFELSLLENKRPPASPDVTILGETSAPDLIHALKSLTRVSDVSGAAAVPALGALDFSVNIEDEKLAIMSTDTYTLAEIKLKFSARDIEGEDAPKDSRFLVHSADAALISKDSADPESVIEIGLDSNGKAAFLFGNGRMACVSKLDEEPIDYQNFKIDRDEEKSIVVDTREFSEAVKIVNKLSFDTDDIFVTLKDNALVITNAAQSSTINVDYDTELTEIDSLDLGDDGLETNFLSTVVLKAFHPIATAKMRVSFVGSQHFFRATPVLESGNDQNEVFILFVPVIRKKG